MKLKPAMLGPRLTPLALVVLSLVAIVVATFTIIDIGRAIDAALRSEPAPRPAGGFVNTSVTSEPGLTSDSRLNADGTMRINGNYFVHTDIPSDGHTGAKKP